MTYDYLLGKRFDAFDWNTGFHKSDGVLLKQTSSHYYLIFEDLTMAWIPKCYCTLSIY